MPWHDNSGNGSDHNDGPTQGPWGQPPRGNGSKRPSGRPGRGGGDTPDLDELLEASRQRLRRAFPRRRGGRGGGGGDGGEFVVTPPMLVGGLLLLIGFWAFSGIYFVNPTQVAVRTTFGKYSGLDGPGPGWRAPFIQGVQMVNVEDQRTTFVGYAGQNTSSPVENLMLTSDRNIVDISFTIDWKISQEAVEPGDLPNPAKYVFNLDNPEKAVLHVAEAAMRETIGGKELDPIITSGQADVNEQTRQRIQNNLDEYQSGIEVLRVNVGRPEPPNAVREAFVDVVRAGNQKDQLINEAQRDANQVVPVAEGQAQKILQDALAYKAQVEADALGQADRFNKIYEEYKKAPEVTRRRMYLETVEKVLPRLNKVVVDEQAGTGIVPYLPLNELTKRSGN